MFEPFMDVERNHLPAFIVFDLVSSLLDTVEKTAEDHSLNVAFYRRVRRLFESKELGRLR